MATLHDYCIAEMDDGITRSTDAMLLTAREACQLCGTSLRTWRSWDSAGKVPQPVRIGRMLYWRRFELLAWIEAGCPRRREWGEIIGQGA